MSLGCVCGNHSRFIPFFLFSPVNNLVFALLSFLEFADDEDCKDDGDADEVGEQTKDIELVVLEKSLRR